MDLIGQLTSQLGIGEDKAQAIAGATIAGIRDQVATDVGEAEAREMDSAIPELDTWQAKAKEFLGGATGDTPGAADSGGGLLGAAGGLLGGASGGAGGGMLGGAMKALGGTSGMDLASITGLLGKLDLDASKAGALLPLIMGFLKDKLPAGLMAKVTSAVPMLAGAGAAGGGLGGAIGNFLK